MIINSKVNYWMIPVKCCKKSREESPRRSITALFVFRACYFDNDAGTDADTGADTAALPSINLAKQFPALAIELLHLLALDREEIVRAGLDIHAGQ